MRVLMCIKFGGCSFSGFKDFVPFRFPSNLPFGPPTLDYNQDHKYTT